MSEHSSSENEEKQRKVTRSPRRDLPERKRTMERKSFSTPTHRSKSEVSKPVTRVGRKPETPEDLPQEKPQRKDREEYRRSQKKKNIEDERKRTSSSSSNRNEVSERKVVRKTNRTTSSSPSTASRKPTLSILNKRRDKVYNLIVQDSTIKGAGKGLFAGSLGFKKDKIIGEYSRYDIICTSDEYKKRDGSRPYGYCTNKGICFDAQDTPDILARYANDMKEEDLNNAEFDEYRGRVFIVASKDIKPYEEIFVSYGRDYWEDREKNDDDTLVNSDASGDDGNEQEREESGEDRENRGEENDIEESRNEENGSRPGSREEVGTDQEDEELIEEDESKDAEEVEEVSEREE